MRSDVIRINFAEIRYINYNARVYRDFDLFALLYIENITIILDVMFTYKGGKLSTAPYKVFTHLFLMPMKLEGKCLKSINSLCTLKCPDSKRRRNLTEYLPVEI